MLSPDYITGLTEGEGSFHVSICRAPRSVSGVRVKPGFSIALVESEESWKLLCAVREALGCGTVRRKRDNRPGHRQQVRFNVDGCTQLRQIVIPFFCAHPFPGPKQKEFELWSSILGVLTQGDSKPSVVAQVQTMRATLNNGGRDRKS